MTSMPFHDRYRRWRLIIAIGLFWSLASAAQDAVTEAQQTQQAIQQAAERTQERIDRLSEEAKTMLEDYRLASQETDRLAAYNDQLARLVTSQTAEIASLRRQIDDVEIVQQGITPLMLRMIEALDRFIVLDKPFLAEERSARVTELRQLMDRADVTTAEKYRRILEAYQVELEYGRTIEAYRGALGGEDTRTVDFLRFGRLMLFYQTLDAQESGVWDTATRSWQRLPSDHRQSIAQGLRMARDQSPPDLLVLPVPAATEAAR